jgi:FixJ family two-component response regulator
MQLADVVEQILETGLLPMAVERQMHKLLKTQEMINPMEAEIIEKLIYGLMSGTIRPIA